MMASADIRQYEAREKRREDEEHNRDEVGERWSIQTGTRSGIGEVKYGGEPSAYLVSLGLFLPCIG